MPATDKQSPEANSVDVSGLLKAIDARTFRVGVIGMGYVGLPLALAAVNAGFSVLGFDIDVPRTHQINRGETFLKHIPSSAIEAAIESGRLEATANFERLAEPDALIICVPTPLTRYREPDLTYVVGTTQAIAANLRRDQLVILESTSFPGTTSEIVRPILTATGLKCGRDFFLAFSPEREDPGNAEFTTTRIPKVVGGDGPEALSLAQALYSQIVERTVPVSSTETAEAVKLTENIFRAVNIALVNELKIVYSAMGVDIWEVIEAAKTKPFGYMPFYPGPGLGGHCIPIDPFYLTWKAREYNIATRFIELAGEINMAMPRYVVDNLAMIVDERFARGLNGASILVLGIAYKKNVDDTRESPALVLIEALEDRGATVEYHDPFVPTIPPTREHAPLMGRMSVSLTPERISSYDAVLIATDHDIVDYGFLAQHARLVIDTRNVCTRTGISGTNIVKV